MGKLKDVGQCASHSVVVFCMCVSTGGHCGCASYGTLLYAMTAAVGVLLIFLIGLVVIYRVGEIVPNKCDATVIIRNEVIHTQIEI